MREKLFAEVLSVEIYEGARSVTSHTGSRFRLEHVSAAAHLVACLKVGQSSRIPKISPCLIIVLLRLIFIIRSRGERSLFHIDD